MRVNPARFIQTLNCNSFVVFVSMAIACRLLELRVSRLWGPVWPSLVAAGVLALVLWPLDQAIDSSWLTLLAAAVLGVPVYVGALWLVAPDSLRELVDRLRGRAAAAG